MSMCHASGCHEPTLTRWGHYCRSHKARLRRHGHPDQRGITKTDLKPFLKLVALRRKKNPDSQIWGYLQGQWDALQSHAESILVAYRAGRPVVSHEMQAAHELRKIAEETTGPEAIDTALAMFVMEGWDQRRFRSERAFRAQLVRRVRCIGEVNVGIGWSRDTGKVRRVYRDVAPKTSEIMAAWFSTAFGMAGLRLVELEARDEEAKQAEVNAMRSALAELV